MTKLSDVLIVINRCTNNQTFGGLYKNSNYPPELIDLALNINLTELINLIELNEDLTLEHIKDHPIYNSVSIFVDKLHKLNSAISEDVNYQLPVIDDYISLVRLKRYQLQELEAGLLLETYNAEDVLIGKAIIKSINYQNKTAKLKYFLNTEEDKVSYCLLDDWWTLSRPEVIWVKDEGLIPNELTISKMIVNYKLDKLRLGRIRWELFYKKSDKDEYILIAKGADILRPGLITIEKKGVLFNVGKFKLKFVDRRIGINTPVKKELVWDIETPTSELNYTYYE